MTELNSSRDLSVVSAQTGNFIRKKKEALTKINSFREKFIKQEKEAREDLEEASRIWKEVSKKFKWWQSLP